MTDIQSVEQVEAVAAKVGITFTAEDYAQADALAAQRLAQIQAQEAASERAASGRKVWVDRFNRWYPRFLRALQGIGDVSISLAQTAIVAFGVPITLLILLIVEQQRVYHGVALFEVDPALASFSAWALVILNLVLELLVSYVEHRAGWQEPPRHEFSLRLLWQRMVYMLGGAVAWQPRTKSPAVRFRAVLRIVTFSILVLALAGSMRVVIERTEGNWLQALGVVMTASNLLEMVTWLGGLLFAVAAVLSAQALSQYAARKAIEIAAILASQQDDRSNAALKAAGMTGAAYLLGRLKDMQSVRRKMGTSPAMGGGGDVQSGSMKFNEFNEFTESDNELEPSKPRTKRASAKLQKVIDWLIANPDHRMTTLEIAEALGVSSGTVSAARNAVKDIS